MGKIIKFPRCEWCDAIGAWRCKICNKWTCENCYKGVVPSDFVGNEICMHTKYVETYSDGWGY